MLKSNNLLDDEKIVSEISKFEQISDLPQLLKYKLDVLNILNYNISFYKNLNLDPNTELKDSDHPVCEIIIEAHTVLNKLNQAISKLKYDSEKNNECESDEQNYNKKNKNKKEIPKTKSKRKFEKIQNKSKAKNSKFIEQNKKSFDKF